MANKLTKSTSEKKLCGVCAGVANFFGMDATVVRLIWLLCVLLAGTGLLLYIICALILPNE